jgi:endonuclease/exonuclease/phosphatase family metal-dependent hydrolase
MRPKRKSLGLTNKFILVFNGIAVLALLLSYLAPVIKPQVFWPVAFLGIAYPVLLAVNLLFILLWLFRKASFAIISLIAIGIGWSAINKNFGFNTAVVDTVVRDTSVIRVMSYNVRMFHDSEGKKAQNQVDILKLIKEVSPDVLCIQEFYSRTKGENNIRKLYMEELGLSFSYFIPSAKNDYDAYGIAIFSKFPIVNSGNVDINTETGIVNKIVYSDINKQGKNFRVYNVHLQSVGFKKEDYDFIMKDVPTANVDVKSTRRIGNRLKLAYIKRNRQIDSLYSHTKDTKMPYIVAGDFNDTPLSYSVNKLSGDMKNAFVEKGRGLGITYNGAFPNFQIDYILASKEFNVQNYQIISEKLSDHYPIWSDLRL